MIVVLDLGPSNLGSVTAALLRLRRDYVVTREPRAVAGAEYLILPGVGTFDTAMRLLGESGIGAVLRRRVEEEALPVLGICLGMQVLARSSEEGQMRGLGLLDGTFHRLPVTKARVPHMGWNHAVPLGQSGCPTWLQGGQRFYFSHSYRMEPGPLVEVLAETDYGLRFPSVVRQGSLVGVQFHPEKSHRVGRQMLDWFLRADSESPCYLHD